MKIFVIAYAFFVSSASAYSFSESAFHGAFGNGYRKLSKESNQKFENAEIPSAAIQHEAGDGLPHEIRHRSGHDMVAASHHDLHPVPLHPDFEGQHAEQVKHEEVAHEHGEVKHEESAHGESAESCSLAILLMGSVASLMTVFYVVNHSNPRIRAATWNVLNMTASIFIAVTIFATFKTTIFGVFHPSFSKRIAITLAMFVCCFVGLHVLLFKVKEGSKLNRHSVATLMAHVTGFGGMYGFSDTAELKSLEELGVYGLFFLVVGAAATILTLICVMDRIMKQIALADGIIDADEEEWIEICDETDDDVFCLALSFLFVLLLRFLIRGKLLPYEPGQVGNITQFEATQILVCGLFFGVLVIAGTALVAKQGASIKSAGAKRAVTGIQHLNSMTMAWCLLFWAEWQIYVWGWESTVIGCCLVISVGMTIFSFCVVILTNVAMDHIRNQGKLARRASKSIELALGILVGFSWERAFDVGFHELGHYVANRAGSHERAHLVLFGVAALLVLVVAPAWHWHILPKTLEKCTPRIDHRMTAPACV